MRKILCFAFLFTVFITEFALAQSALYAIVGVARRRDTGQGVNGVAVYVNCHYYGETAYEGGYRCAAQTRTCGSCPYVERFDIILYRNGSLPNCSPCGCQQKRPPSGK